MAVCAVLCRADNLSERFGRPLKGGTLSHDTFGDVFRVLDGRIFETRFRDWINGLAGLIEGVVAIDGKTLRGRGREEATKQRVLAYGHGVRGAKQPVPGPGRQRETSPFRAGLFSPPFVRKRVPRCACAAVAYMPTETRLPRVSHQAGFLRRGESRINLNCVSDCPGLRLTAVEAATYTFIAPTGFPRIWRPCVGCEPKF